MDRKTLIADLRSQCGSMITVTALKDYMKCGRRMAMELLSDKDFVNVGNKRFYAVADVAEALLERRQR